MLAPYAKLFLVSVTDEYETMPPPHEMLRYIDGLFIFGSSDLFFDGQKDEHDPAKKQTRSIVEALRPLTSHIIERDFPTFAFCFGHQLIAHTMGSPIIASPHTAKVGTYAIDLTSQGMKDPLLQSFPETFMAHYGHKDVVAVRPEMSTLLAHGRLCHNAMLRYGKNIYTSQFHPELPGHVMQKYLHGHATYTEESVARNDFKDAPEAEQLPVRFVELLKGKL
jgi:GMP synthase (glutamine-hydrolysing)